MRYTVMLAALLIVGCQQTPETNTTAEVDPTTGSFIKRAKVILPDSHPSPLVSTSKPDYSDGGKQQAWISRGEDTIRAKLRDPDSAQFRNTRFHSGGGVPIACGEVNANNGFGGKAGYERFIAAGSSMAVLESEMSSASDMDEVWAKFCTG